MSKVDFYLLIPIHHISAISSADIFKLRLCDSNVLFAGISLTSGVEILHNRRFVFEPKLTRIELI